MEKYLRYSAPAVHFEQALPIGNGTLGAMVYGGWDTEKISLNHDTLWSGKPRRYTKPHAKQAYAEAQRLVMEGRGAEATTLLEREFSASFGESYLPMGDLVITRLGASHSMAAYRRELDLEHGLVSVWGEDDTGRQEREYFVSYTDDCLVVRFTCGTPSSFRIAFHCQLRYTVSAESDRLTLLGECPSAIAPEYARDLVETTYNGEGIHFAATVTVETDGTSRTDGDAVIAENATTLCLRLCARTSYTHFDAMPTGAYKEPCQACADALRGVPFATLRARHTERFASLYNRVTLDLGFGENTMMTDERLLRFAETGDLGLVELLFHFGRYLMIASHGTSSEASNLQGIWNESVFPPWSSNYTVNINTEMNYWPTLMCGYAEMNLPLIGLLRKISVTGRDAARNFYGAEGYCAHHNVDIWGLATPVGAGGKGCLCYAYWPMSSGWLCRHAWEHYEYTLDRDYLRDAAYPLMRGAAEFYHSVLISDGEHDILCPSTSPENAYYDKNHEKLAIARYTTMSQAIVMDLFTNLLRAAEILGEEDALLREIRERLPRLNTYAIGTEGQLLEYDEEYEEPERHHRHVSHLYGLYPGESITTGATPALAEACRQSLIRRGDAGTGWSIGWKINLWAKLKDGDHALALVKRQITPVSPVERRSWRGGGTYPNLFDAHPPFQIDGNFGVCAGIAQMLLQCEDGKIRLLPALPRELACGSVSGLKAKGDVTVSMTWCDGTLTSCTLFSPHTQRVTVSMPDREVTVTLTAGEITNLIA
ncbi:MAG: glycoside hydrolase family 95 protein [Clostridia bacterium]|nr:glycoside hydrolase family 95 protein [Clostridia bacterium]